MSCLTQHLLLYLSAARDNSDTHNDPRGTRPRGQFSQLPSCRTSSRVSVPYLRRILRTPVNGDRAPRNTPDICVQQTSNISSNRFEAPEKKVVDFVEKQAIIASVPRLFTRSSSSWRIPIPVTASQPPRARGGAIRASTGGLMCGMYRLRKSPVSDRQPAGASLRTGLTGPGWRWTIL